MEISRAGHRFLLRAMRRDKHMADFARDVAEGLRGRPKTLSCRYLYDRRGSELFEQICELPEYYPTRAEKEILERHAPQIVAHLASDVHLVELGSGSGVKTRVLIEALLDRQDELEYIPIDISRAALEESARSLLDAYPALEIHGLVGEYADGLKVVHDSVPSPRLILWLGSSIGNFESHEALAFTRKVRDAMDEDDRFLVGMDLQKDRVTLERAYDDARGVTARFNKNLLDRINRELGGHFDTDAFEHRAVYNESEGRIEVYLVSEKPQRIAIDEIGLEVDFDRGEAIHTENSHKYTTEQIEALAAQAGLRLDGQWFDSEKRFSLNLLAVD